MILNHSSAALEIPHHHGARKPITVFRKSLFLGRVLSKISSIHILTPYVSNFIISLESTSRSSKLSSPSGGFLTCITSPPFRSFLFNRRNNISSRICIVKHILFLFFDVCIISSPLGPNILLSTLSLSFPCSVRPSFTLI